MPAQCSLDGTLRACTCKSHALGFSTCPVYSIQIHVLAASFLIKEVCHVHNIVI